MAGFSEVLFISDEIGTPGSIQCYDLQLGSRIMMYRGGGGTARGTLNILGEDYLMTADVSKPFLHVWRMVNDNPVKRVVMPGKVTALAFSEDCTYCAAGIDKKIYIWNFSSGQLLNVVVYHHEPITKIVFWDCSCLISIGADGLVAVWRLIDIISKQTGEAISSTTLRNQPPFFSSAQHSLPVTDIHLAPAGNTARFFTVSADQTCQIYNLNTDCARILLTLTFDHVLTSVVVDRLQRRLFVGTDSGKIILFWMEPLHDCNMYHVNSEKDENIFIGHSGAVNTLALSQDDSILVSGSEDKNVIVWNTRTRQQMFVYQQHGPVAVTFFRIMSSDFMMRNSNPKIPLPDFARTVVASPEDIQFRIMVTNDTDSEEPVPFSYEAYLSSLFKKEQHADPSSSKVKGANSTKEKGKDNKSKKTDTFAVDDESDEFESADEDVIEDEDVFAGDVNSNNKRSPSDGKIDCDKVKSMRSEISRLKTLNQRLRKVNQRLYLFGLDQVLRGRFRMGNDIID